MAAFPTAPPPFNPHLQPQPAQYPGMAPHPQFVVQEREALGLTAEATMQIYPGAGLMSQVPPTGYHVGYPAPPPPQPECHPVVGYHPALVQQHSLGSLPQQHRHSLQPQPTFPTFEAQNYSFPQPGYSLQPQPTFEAQNYSPPQHGHSLPRRCTLPTFEAQNITSITHLQQTMTLQRGYHPQHSASSEPVTPYGYNIADVFQEGNIIQLIPRGESAPIKLSGSHIKPNGDYLHPENTFFRVKLPYPGIVQLSNYNRPKHLITIDKKGLIKGDGKETGDKSCQFKVHLKESEGKRYIYLESMKYPDFFLSMKEGGKKFGPNDMEAQFRVRVEQWVTPRKTVLQAFGRPSIANKLRDGGTIQLKGKASNMYLRINKRGVVDEVLHRDDKLTYFSFIDRGMGVVSLHSYLHGGYRIRISNCVLEGKGDPDPPADFYLKETRDGAVSLESVTCPGTYVSVGKGSTKSTAFAVHHVEIDKHGKQEAIKTTPLTP